TTLVTRELAACCNIIQGVISIYRWQGKVETDNEILMIIKSTEENYKAIENSIKELHPYEVPEIISLPIRYGFEKYLKWINDVTKAGHE
ncbi:MAG TPA: divalent-cation tolerance protein CutA, partial [Calditrichaeota bacterium]|nr:divalent-cation tolerance protein CutA [Calditrichota bacterium]